MSGRQPIELLDSSRAYITIRSAWTDEAKTADRAVRIGLALTLIDRARGGAGGVSLSRPVSGMGFGPRLGIVIGLLLFDFVLHGRRDRLFDYGYIAVLLILVPILHSRGYRLRGDGLWYYSFAHSLAFDADIDLANQYRSLGIARMTGSLPEREPGRALHLSGRRAPLLRVPLVELGHVGSGQRTFMASRPPGC